MPLRILFADDSMTAQNMGKKILTEAGYDVIAVSNGAAAVKKIAEQKPDIIILDVYMPGYSGLEVCEKVRASLETAKTPVLLTVGKMEPHKPEDANRVKADGVIIKPFEASDLLAIIKKFEERVGPVAPAPPVVEQTILLERRFVEDALSGASDAQLEHHHSTGKTGTQPMVEVPDHMATSAAFSDLLGTDSSLRYNVGSSVPAFEAAIPMPPPPPPASQASEFDLPVSWRREDSGEPVAGIPVMVESVIDAPPVVVDPTVETVSIPAEPAFVVEPEPAADPAPMSFEVERFGAISIPVEPAVEAAPVVEVHRFEAVPVEAAGPSFETIPIMEDEPVVETASVVEATPVIEPETVPVLEAVPVAEPEPIVEVAILETAVEETVSIAAVAAEPVVAAVPEAATVEEPVVTATPVAAEPVPPPPHPFYIPVYREPEPEPEPEPEASSYEIIPTAASPTEEIEIPQEPALLQTAEETTRNTVADLTEPGLMPTILESQSLESQSLGSQSLESQSQEPEPIEAKAQEAAAREYAVHEPAVYERNAVRYFPVAEPVAEAKPAEVEPVVEPPVVEAPVASANEAEGRAESASKVQEMAALEIPAEASVEVLRSDNLSSAPDRLAEDADFDFEARVAAAMAAYNQTPVVEEPPVTEEAHAAISEEHAPSASTMEADVHDRSTATPAEPAEAVRRELEPPSSFEYYPPIRVPELPRVIDRSAMDRSSVMETPAVEAAASVASVPVAEPAPPDVEATTSPVAAPVPPEEMKWAAAPVTPPEPEVVESIVASAQHNAAVAAGLQAALPTAVSAAEQAGADQEVIAQVVSRVMDRLKPTLVEEILRELKSNK